MSDDMTKAQLVEAKTLIQQKRYFEARKILKRLDHPTARAWEAKLDTIAPVSTASPRKSKVWIWVALALGISALMAVGLVLFINNQSRCDKYGWWKTVANNVTHFLDSAETASKTPRMSIATVILDMRQAKRDYDNLSYPKCVSNIQDDISRGMDYAIAGFESFASSSDLVSGVKMTMANQYFYNADVALSLLADRRMYNTGVFIWGGDDPTDVRATEWAVPVDGTSVIATNNAIIITATAQASKP